MSRWAYVNGRFVRHGDAAVHIEDRGYQLSDGIYEVWAVVDGRLIDVEGHFERLQRSLSELRITPPMARRPLELVLREAIRRNRVTYGLVYLQVTRGVAPRDHAFPDPMPAPAIVITAKSINRTAADARAAKGITVITMPEIRWGRCDIKTIGLLPNSLAKQAAREQGAGEAWFVDDDGLITEGASSNAWIVDAEGVLRTRDTTANILRGVTRKSVLGLLGEVNIRLDERAFTPEEAKNAREAFITGAGALVMPVVGIDGSPIGDGRPGPVAQRLRALYIRNAQTSNS
ncbi:MAG: D-amino-acid transaminase [Caulobacter sp.]|nr:D-amino-acid transaminase [Caulobacter sp.]